MQEQEDGRQRVALRYADTPYQRWEKAEGIPVHGGSYVDDLHTAEVALWPRLGQKGAFINLGAQELDDGWLVELAPGGQTEPLKHLFEASIYIVEGRGATTIWQDGSNKKQTVEWSTGSLFSPPINSSYQHFNLDGQRPARLFAGTTAPLMINATRDPEFIFNCPYAFTNRYDQADDYFSRPAEQLAGRDWRTNFVPDARGFNLDLDLTERRGRGNASNGFVLSANGMRVRIMQFPIGSYKKGHRHGPGAYVMILNGTGYSTFWFKGQPVSRVAWKEGTLFSPREDEYHQHFNTGTSPTRYMACLYSSLVAANTQTVEGSTVSEEDGGWQIEYEDEDPEVYALFERECAQHGAKVELPRPQYRPPSVTAGSRGV
ncbi:MAG TPA: ethanolamine ammonia lyase-activating protein [Chloroflexota bacterium]